MRLISPYHDDMIIIINLFDRQCDAVPVQPNFLYITLSTGRLLNLGLHYYYYFFNFEITVLRIILYFYFLKIRLLYNLYLYCTAYSIELI